VNKKGVLFLCDAKINKIFNYKYLVIKIFLRKYGNMRSRNEKLFRCIPAMCFFDFDFLQKKSKSKKHIAPKVLKRP
jgi:hypothetical protein